MQRSIVINIVGLTRGLLKGAPALDKFAKASEQAVIDPVLPAVTCSAQSTYLTGRSPAGHGAVANGWYDRTLAEHHFWKQSNHLVEGEKLWEALRKESPDFTCAKLFWWYNMYSTAEFSITPRPMYPADGRKVFDVYTHPMEMREQIKADLGDFPFPSFWGPMAGLPSSRWIADSAMWVERREQPSLSLVYLPHLDYDFQRYGPDSAEAAKALVEIDALFAELLAFYEERDVRVVVLSEYGITAVDRPVHLNRIFRERGWVTIKEELGRELIDLGASQVFAIADHQLAHVYVRDPALRDEVIAALAEVDGVEEVIHGSGLVSTGVAHERSGDLVVVADSRSWFTYYYWNDDAVAPDFARCVDIHRKPGYDPAELFLDPSIGLPKLKVAGKLARKAMGMRMLMDVIPLDASLVKGSHGRRPENEDDWPVLIGDFPGLQSGGAIAATEVYTHLLEFCRSQGSSKTG